MPATLETVELEPFFTARLPLPPSINHTYRPVKRGRAGMRLALTEEAILFKEMAWAALSNPQCEWDVVNAIRKAPIDIPLAIDMTFYFASARRDEDSGIKIAQDAIFTRLDLDDKLVVDLRVKKKVDETNPRLEVALRCLLTTER